MKRQTEIYIKQGAKEIQTQKLFTIYPINLNNVMDFKLRPLDDKFCHKNNKFYCKTGM